MLILVKGSKKDLVRRQKACINEVSRMGYEHPKCQEVINDFQRWSNESKVFKNVDNTAKWVTSYERRSKESGEKKEEKESM
jgi:hypothetical protein